VWVIHLVTMIHRTLIVCEMFRKFTAFNINKLHVIANLPY